MKEGWVKWVGQGHVSVTHPFPERKYPPGTESPGATQVAPARKSFAWPGLSMPARLSNTETDVDIQINEAEESKQASGGWGSGGNGGVGGACCVCGYTHNHTAGQGAVGTWEL